jgi:ABC-type nitrate/sulfonate/bicarbonate transport system permease component
MATGIGMSGHTVAISRVLGTRLEAGLAKRRPHVNWRAAGERVLGAVVGFGLLTLIWWLVANALGPARLPEPLAVASIMLRVLSSSSSLKAQDVSGGIGPGLVYSSERVLLGVGIGAFVGMILGLTMGLSRTASQFLSAPIEMIRAIPPLAAAPFFLIWFGIGASGQVLLIAFYAAVMIVINARSSVQHIDPVYQNFAATLGAGWLQRARTIVVPAFIPELVGGARVALGFAWGVEVVAELLGSESGIGHDFVLLSVTLQVDEIIAGIIWISLIAAVVDRLYLLSTAYFTRWVPPRAH